jgi:hypothetical protein
MTPLPKFTRTRLNLQALEDRATPATFTYAPFSQTLTVTAGEGDRILVASIPNKPTGYLQVSETQAAATVFNSDTTNQSIRTLVVRFGNVQSGGLTLAADARIGGGLIVSGAQTSQTLDLLGSVGGNLTYTAAPTAAFDDLDVEASAHVGGNMNVQLGLGENTLRLKGGLVRGNLTVLGKAGTDRVEVTESADLVVGGAASFNLGDGPNTLLGHGLAHTLRVGTNFTYTGGAGNDSLDLDGAGTALQAGGNVRVVLGNPRAFDVNEAEFEALTAGRHVSFVGGMGADTVTLSGALNIGGNVSANLGQGTNRFDSNLLGEGTNSIGGTFTYAGGAGGDVVLLDVASIGRNVNVALGESGGANQSLTVGAKGPAGVAVYGNVRVTSGSGADAIGLARLYVGGSLNVLSGSGTDMVLMDDINVAGATLLDLGLGDDQLLVETQGGLGSSSSFGGKVTVKSGDGTDVVNLSDDANAGTLILFGSRVALVGGAGEDTVRNADENVFEVTGNLIQFETKIGKAIS